MASPWTLGKHYIHIGHPTRDVQKTVRMLLICYWLRARYRRKLKEHPSTADVDEFQWLRAEQILHSFSFCIKMHFFVRAKPDNPFPCVEQDSAILAVQPQQLQCSCWGKNYWGLEAAGLKPISPIRHWNHRDLSVKMWNNMKCCNAQPTEMAEIVLACTLVYVTCCYRMLYGYLFSKCSSHTTQNQDRFRRQPKMYAINWTRAADIFDAWCFSQPRLAWINSTRGHAKVVLCSFVKIC